MSLPKTLYVYEEQESDGSKYYIASKDSHEQMNGVVGVYELKDELFVRHKPQFRRKRTKTWFDK